MGFPKTGSTSLQAFLLTNHKALQAKNIHVPLSIRGDSSSTIHHQSMCLCDSTMSLEPLITEMQAYPGHDFIISDELLGFGSYLISKEQCEKLQQRFPGMVIKTISYIRRLDSGLLAAFNQRVKRYTLRAPADSLTTVQTRRFDYLSYIRWVHKNGYSSFGAAKVLANSQKLFGEENTIIRLFDKRFLVDGDIVSDFFATIGLDIAEGFTREKRRNVSPPHDIVPFFMTEALPPMMQEKSRRKFIDLATDTFLLKNSAGSEAQDALLAEIDKLDKQFAEYSATVAGGEQPHSYKDLYKGRAISLNSPDFEPNRHTLYMIRQLNYIYNEARQTREALAERNKSSVLIWCKRAALKQLRQHKPFINKCYRRLRSVLPG